MSEVSQEAREAEVTQADEALANEIHARCFEFDFDGPPFDLNLAKQIIARHRQQAERAFEERERKLREALRKIQDEGDARANAIATQALKDTPDG